MRAERAAAAALPLPLPLLLLLLCALPRAAAHPQFVACAADAATPLQLGGTVMGERVQPAPASLRIAAEPAAYLSGGEVALTISGLPPGAEAALRASDGSGTLRPATGYQQVGGEGVVCSDARRIALPCDDCGPNWGDLAACQALCSARDECTHITYFANDGCRVYSGCADTTPVPPSYHTQTYVYAKQVDGGLAPTCAAQMHTTGAVTAGNASLHPTLATDCKAAGGVEVAVVYTTGGQSSGRPVFIATLRLTSAGSLPACSAPTPAPAAPKPTPSPVPHTGPPVPYFGAYHPGGYTNAVDGRPVKHRGEYFDVYTPPMRLRYAQVHNRMMPTVGLPGEIVRRFAGKTMAITGYENQNIRFDNQTGREIMVPCSDLYNHHWNLYLAGSAGRLSAAERAAAEQLHANGPWEPAAPPPGQNIPVRQVLSEANGNEHRGTFHGTPRGYAQLLHSPEAADLMHMSINTHNPAGGVPGDGPQPSVSTSPPGAPWTGVLECPCTTRTRPTGHGGCIPGGELERMHNPICSVATYSGGLKCCGHDVILLDKDQPDYPVETYYHKLRVYFEEYDPTTMKNAFRLFWQTEEWATEYEIPQCPQGTPPRSCVHTLTSRLKVRDLFGGLTSPVSKDRLNCSLVNDVWCGQIQDVEAAGGKFKLIYMAYHQHSPALISGELINADTGALICRNEPLYGMKVGAPLDEKGYAVGIPPCVWGSEEEGLPPPPVLDLDTNLLVVGKYNSTTAHYGVMGQWQGRGGL